MSFFWGGDNEQQKIDQMNQNQGNVVSQESTRGRKDNENELSRTSFITNIWVMNVILDKMWEYWLMKDVLCAFNNCQS